MSCNNNLVTAKATSTILCFWFLASFLVAPCPARSCNSARISSNYLDVVLAATGHPPSTPGCFFEYLNPAVDPVPSGAVCGIRGRRSRIWSQMSRQGSCAKFPSPFYTSYLFLYSFVGDLSTGRTARRRKASSRGTASPRHRRQNWSFQRRSAMIETRELSAGGSLKRSRTTNRNKYKR